jgi:hypothetical protein
VLANRNEQRFTVREGWNDAGVLPLELHHFELPAPLPVRLGDQGLAVAGEQVEVHEGDWDAASPLQNPLAEQVEIGLA